MSSAQDINVYSFAFDSYPEEWRPCGTANGANSGNGNPYWFELDPLKFQPSGHVDMNVIYGNRIKRNSRMP
jgi:hypothetical protein